MGRCMARRSRLGDSEQISGMPIACLCRLMLLEYCVGQRGDLEDVQHVIATMQSRRELVAQVFSAWRDCVTSQRRDGMWTHWCRIVCLVYTLQLAPCKPNVAVVANHPPSSRAWLWLMVSMCLGLATQILAGYGSLPASMGGGASASRTTKPTTTAANMPRATSVVDEF